MPLDPPPIQDTTLLSTQRFTVRWVRWFQSAYSILAGKQPIQLASYTVLTLPPPVQGQFIYVSNEAGGAQTAFSDGLVWRRSSDRAIVS